jgi:hypothetical protein
MTTDAKARCEDDIRKCPQSNVTENAVCMEHFTEKVKAEISRFNPYCEQITYTTLGCLAGTLKAVLNDGSAGTGKSRSTLELAKLFPSIHVRVVSGRITPLAMYELLYECRFRNSVLIIDESFTLLADSNIQQMLRCALYSGVVDWRSKGEKFESLNIPETFNFNGRIVFNTNLVNNKDFNYKAMLDRVYYNKLILTGEQITEKMKSKRSYAPDKKVWQLLGQRLLLIRNGKLKTRLSKQEKDAILEYTVNKILEISRTYNTNISMRILERIETLCLFLKQLFGKLDLEFAKSLAKQYFVINDEEDFIKKVIVEAGGMIPAKDLTAILSDTQKYSLRTAQRRIQEYVELGKIVIPKRGYVALKRVTRPNLSVSPTPPAPPTPREPTPVNPPMEEVVAQETWDDFCTDYQVSPVSSK